MKPLARMVLKAALFLALSTSAAPSGEASSANRLESAILEVRADIERDTEALNELRARIEAERRPLAARLDALQKTVAERRADAERIRRLTLHGEKEQAALKREAAAIEEEYRFLESLFTEQARAMETRVGPADAARLAERLRPIQTALSQSESADGLAGAVGRLLALAEDWNRERFGGARFAGVALDQDGIEHPGRFAVIGPAAYFAAEREDGPAGLAVTQFGADRPSIAEDLPGGAAEAIRTLADGRAARVPVDVTGGDALRVAETRETPIEHLRRGGFVMIPLLAVALAAMALAVWKAVELGGIRVEPGPEAAAALDAIRRGDLAAARAETARIRPPLRALVEEAAAHRDAPRDHLEEILHERVLSALPRLERNLGTLAVLGGIAPLLGLLGTVTGMIHTFQLVTIFGSGDAKLLSGGISEALVTTETGLAIAIPVLLAHAFLARRARGIVGALERAAVGMVNDLKVRSH
jgi:biopolymer transport protein ExbB